MDEILQDEIQQLRRRVADLKTMAQESWRRQIDTIHHLGEAMLRYLNAEVREEQLRVDLMTFGNHLNDCEVWMNEHREPGHYAKCSCGWAEVEQGEHYATAEGDVL